MCTVRYVGINGKGKHEIKLFIDELYLIMYLFKQSNFSGREKKMRKVE